MDKYLQALALASLLVGIFGGARASTASDWPLQPTSNYVHGTIAIVVSTRDGFVLATDSRASNSDGTHTDDARKAFTVGSRAACVFAGLVGSEIGMEGYRLRDAIGSHLTMLDKQVAHQSSSALELARAFQ